MEKYYTFEERINYLKIILDSDDQSLTHLIFLKSLGLDPKFKAASLVYPDPKLIDLIQMMLRKYTEDKNIKVEKSETFFYAPMKFAYGAAQAGNEKLNITFFLYTDSGKGFLTFTDTEIGEMGIGKFNIEDGDFSIFRGREN